MSEKLYVKIRYLDVAKQDFKKVLAKH